jgi:Asp/Glu/hydantoin racemase
MTRRLTFVHAVASLVPVFDDLARELIPDAEVRHLVDEPLLNEAIATSRVPRRTAVRLERHLRDAAAAGADLVVVTCPSMGHVVDTVRERRGLPVVRIDEAMAERAVELGSRVGVLATLRSALEPTVSLVRRHAGEQPIEVVPCLCEGAYAALRAGDTDEHDELVRASIRELLPQVDVIVLAEPWIARVAASLGEEAADVPILASPRLGVERAAVALLSAD